MMVNILGIDVGGANLKLADHYGNSRSVAFPLWKQQDLLAERLADLFGEFEKFDLIVATMTGELADCYTSKEEGVDQICRAIQTAADGRPVLIWQTAGEFVDVKTACEFPTLTAAANWHALATWAARSCPTGQGLLIDIGSTTVDLIPLEQGNCMASGRTDPERLCSQELVYTGSRRTPVSAVVQNLVWRGQSVRVAAEYFASMQDVYLITGEFPEQPDSTDTADGRPADQSHARQRLARMLCCDQQELTQDEILHLATQIRSAQQQQIANSLMHVLSRWQEPPEVFVLSGSGQFIATTILDQHSEWVSIPRISLTSQWGTELSAAACAHALVLLASERVEILKC